MSLTEVSAQRDAAFRVVDGGQHVAEPFRRHALMEALPVAALRQDVHAVRPADESKKFKVKSINQSTFTYKALHHSQSNQSNKKKTKNKTINKVSQHIVS